MKFTIENRLITPILPTYTNSGIAQFPFNTKRITDLQAIPRPDLNRDFQFNPELQSHLAGKQLLLDDLPNTLQEIHDHYENGFITYRRGIEQKGGNPSCYRCGNRAKELFASFLCARCGELCTYCRNCIMMGRVSECTPLIGWIGAPPDFDPPEKILEWTGTLSDGQQNASNRAVDAVRQNSSLLVWAVCGAGKTEVLFAAIETALKDRKRVCIATPRTDVVLELTPRLQAAFPSVKIASLYGGSEDRHLFSQLTIATTHQLIRFYEAFDMMVLDEVDAFPYTVDKALQHAADQARKPVSSIIYLTATPNRKWQQECRSGKRVFVTIPARFHRHPLPIPEFRWCGNWRRRLQKGNLPRDCLRWIEKRLSAGKQALVFFPHIQSMQAALPLLQKLNPDIEAVHAEDPNRKEKVAQTRKGAIPILLTTTILERGVTLANIDVAVIGAEDRTFTDSALVQIAGRAGRSAAYPDGTVTFFHFGKTIAMERAQMQIKMMNKEAKSRGLIKDSLE
ncbi:DNA/RNA helicase [Bacillus sp. FJAT-27225]|uniref:DEAD/DEAH box helicase n=1 Tax=Bacillus sp. FJAT-27225 TaxID=1743144 RepID=UPI00080C3427|nr:DEAD/DEAH box helicase [Bacillus sp. FJAT-27225]OCA88257.1 DNA/RNA helicase [Bacillus sp. FJAT-27225]